MLKQTYHTHKETINNFIWRILQVFGKQGVTFLIFILCAKVLIPYEFGIFNYALAIIFFLIMFGDFGISTATSKYVAEYNVVDKNKLKAVLFNSGIIMLGLTIIITIITLLFGKLYLQDKYIYVLYLLPLIFLAPMTSLYDGIYRGLKQFKKLSVISLIIGILSLSFVYLLIKQYGLIGALIAQNLFYFLLLIGLALGYREFHFKLNKEVIGEIGRYSFIYGLAILGNFLFIRFGVLLLGYYDYIEEIAVYELLNRIFMILVFPFTILGQVVAPDFSVLSAKKQYKIIYNKLKNYTIVFFVIGLILGILLYFIIPEIIKIFFSKYYNNLFNEIFIFSLIIFITNIWGATVDFGITVPTGYADLMAKFYIILGIFGVVLSFILLHFFGYIGIIYAFTISSILMVVGLRTMYFAKLYSNVPSNK